MDVYKLYGMCPSVVCAPIVQESSGTPKEWVDWPVAQAHARLCMRRQRVHTECILPLLFGPVGEAGCPSGFTYLSTHGCCYIMKIILVAEVHKHFRLAQRTLSIKFVALVDIC